MQKEEVLMKDIYKKKVTKNIFRYKWIYENFLNGVHGKKILEIGIGVGGIVQFLKKDNEVIGSEISQSAINLNKELGIKTLKIDLDNGRFPFKDHNFDIIIFIGTIEHLNNPQNAINEIKRLIKPNGRILISIPNPLTGHYQIYPGLYTYKYFTRYLHVNNFKIVSFKKYGIRPPFYDFLMKRKSINNSVNSQTENMAMGRFVYNLSNGIFKLKPKRFGWSWIFEIRYLGDNKKYEEFIKEFSSVY